MSDGDGSSLASAEAFSQDLEQHARAIFASSDRYHKIKSIAGKLTEDVRRLTHRGTSDVVAIAIVGKVGEGKSWLARCFLTDHADNRHALAEIRSGQNDRNRSKCLTWLGPEQPIHTAPGEQFLLVNQERMLDLGRPYVVGDTPGFSDGDIAMQTLSSVAVNSAPIKIVVLSESDLRDGEITDFMRSMDGAIILPVIRFRPEPPESKVPGEESQADAFLQLAEWRNSTPSAEILEPCFMPRDREFAGDAKAVMRARLQEALAPVLVDAQQLRCSVDRQIEERIKAAKRDTSVVLEGFRDRVASYVDHLEEMSRRLPEHLLRELLGEDALLRTGARHRLRVDWMERTSSICFPYRSFLGILTLTAGAWDKLIFSVLGSIPSWAVTVFQSLKNVRESRKLTKRTREGAASRVQRLLEYEFRGELRKFRNALNAVAPEETEDTARHSDEDSAIRILGLDKVDGDSENIFQTVTATYRTHPVVPRIFGVLATLTFWLLMFWPVVALYRGYLNSGWRAVVEGSASWSDFPTHAASMLFTSFVLSAAPVFVFALIGVWWSCRPKLESQIVTVIRRRHREDVLESMANGSLRIEIIDPRLNAARFLLNLPTRPFSAK